MFPLHGVLLWVTGALQGTCLYLCLAFYEALRKKYKPHMGKILPIASSWISFCVIGETSLPHAHCRSVQLWMSAYLIIHHYCATAELSYPSTAEERRPVKVQEKYPVSKFSAVFTRVGSQMHSISTHVWKTDGTDPIFTWDEPPVEPTKSREHFGLHDTTENQVAYWFTLLGACLHLLPASHFGLFRSTDVPIVPANVLQALPWSNHLWGTRDNFAALLIYYLP